VRRIRPAKQPVYLKLHFAPGECAQIDWGSFGTVAVGNTRYLAQLVEGEATLRENRSIERRIKNARFPVLKTLEDFQWSWPKKINRPQIQNLFRLAFIERFRTKEGIEE